MEIQAYFEDIDYEIIKILKSSKESVRICVAWISGQIYASILNELAHKGVVVELIFDNNATNLNHGVPASNLYKSYPINTRLSSSFMHNKFCIVDNSVLITGSFNWSQKAKHSFENIIVIKNEFNLVKDFLHEFYDLIEYYNAFTLNKVSKCSCRSNLYNLGVLGSESGKYDESKVDIWSVCVKNSHVVHLGEEYEQYLHTHLGMKDEIEVDDDIYDKESMISEFQQEQLRTNSLQQYFNNRSGNKIHAIGRVVIDNWNEHMEWGEEPEYVVRIFWRDMYFRKIIPDMLYDDGYDGIHSIIAEHV